MQGDSQSIFENDVMIKSATVLPAKGDSDVMFVYIVIRDL